MDQKTDDSIDYLTKKSINETKKLIEEANNLRSMLETSNRKMFARMLKDTTAVALVISLSDEVLRIKSKYQGITRMAFNFAKAGENFLQ